jgi:endoglucanase
MKSSPRAILGYTLIVFALAIGAWLAYLQSGKQEETLVFSERAMLASLWEEYKLTYLEPGTLRTLDKQQNNITTSEGQSYTMLRAIWMDDKETFDTSYQWTKDNLGRPNDYLFSWLFGKRDDGTYGVLSQKGGANTASDADSDIALALLFASQRWGDEKYLDEAKNIISDIWIHEVVMIDGAPYLAANNLEKFSGKSYIIVNPSYYAPYAYRVFAVVDTDHPWQKLVGSSYSVIEQSLKSRLNTTTSANLPPDWVIIDKATGEVRAPVSAELSTDYTYNALRLPWRLALDWEWYKDPRAKEALDKLELLSHKWETEQKLTAAYSHGGASTSDHEVPAMYGGSLGYFIISDPANAKVIYETKLKTLYSMDSNGWKEPLSYYDDNWAWFGMALYTKHLPNLGEDLTHNVQVKTSTSREPQS